jgi:multidrug efflux pump subunit AcrA (membrane-fusion protein)
VLGGYVLKRYVDIGDHVKKGQLLAEITAPEVEVRSRNI